MRGNVPGIVDERARIESALEYIDAEDRDKWVRTGMAIQRELGPGGFAIWDRWSRGASNYNERDTEDAWRSFNSSGTVSLGTLFHLARENGWRDNTQPRELTPGQVEKQRRSREEARRKDEEETARQQKQAAERADAIWKQSAKVTEHPYLARKQVAPTDTLRRIDAAQVQKILGYAPQASGQPLTGTLLVVPARKAGDPALCTVELIDGDGRKTALAGRGTKTKAFWSTERLDDPGELLMGEGMATTLSAAQAAGVPGVAALSSSNLQGVALAMREQFPSARITILADLVKDSGEPDPNAVKAARAVSGFLAVPDFGPSREHGQTDFNDLHVARGPDAVRACITAATPAGYAQVKLDDGPLTDRDEELIERIRAGRDGAVFESLRAGDLDPDDPDQSAADLELCTLLARHTGGDTAQMSRVFNTSRLADRAEWRDRPDYQQRIIHQALQGLGLPPEESLPPTPAPPAFDSIEPLDIAWCLRTPPPPKVFHAYPYIPAGNVGLLVGTGGAGKSYLLLSVCVGLAIGRSFGPFEIEQPRRALIVNVEDPAEDLHFRLHAVTDAFCLSFEEQQLLKQNLRILPARGKLQPLMQFDERRNPQISTSYGWLQEQVDAFQPDVLALDTKSRLFGLDENSNDHASQWLTALERLIADHPALSIIVVNHVSKTSANTGDTGQHATRGASALADNARFVLSFANVGADEARRLGGGPDDELVQLTHAKASYARKAEPALFRRGAKGVLYPVDKAQMRGDQIAAVVERLHAILLEEHPDGINGRVLREAREEYAKDIRSRCLGEAGLNSGTWGEVIQFGIESLRLKEFQDETSTAPRKPVLIRAAQLNSIAKSFNCQNHQKTLFGN